MCVGVGGGGGGGGGVGGGVEGGGGGEKGCYLGLQQFTALLSIL